MFYPVFTAGTQSKLEISEDETILLLTVSGKMSNEDARQINEAVESQLNNKNKSMTLVIDSEALKVDPLTDFRSVQRELTYASSPLLERIYMITSNKLTRLWMLLIHKRATSQIKFITDVSDIVNA